MKLQSYPLIEARWALYVSLSLVAAVIAFYGRLGWTTSLRIWLVLAFVVVAAAILTRIHRHVSIDIGGKILCVDYRLRDRVLHRKTTDISKLAWIRARMTYDDAATVKMSTIIEGGTRGYETILFLKKPLESYERRADSSILAGEIATALGIESKGFKELS